MFKSFDPEPTTNAPRLVDALIKVMNCCAAGLLLASALLLMAAAVGEGAGWGSRFITDITRGDMIALATQH